VAVNPLVQQAATLIANAEYTIALTGAGSSTPSGVPDFRSPQSGLWEKFDPMIVASIHNFKHHPESFYEWVGPLAKTLLDATPNPSHEAFAKLEALGKIQAIITQNIDMLHSRAGSQTVHEVHGHMRTATCIRCYAKYDGQKLLQDFLSDDGKKVIRCEKCDGIIKPDVILFGEQLPALVLEAAERAVRRCDLMIVAGSSLEVYPVADFPRQARTHGAKLILVNYDTTSYDAVADVVIHDDVAKILPQIVSIVETIES